MPYIHVQHLVHAISQPNCDKFAVISDLVEFVRFEKHAQILYSSDEVCAFVIDCCLAANPPPGIWETALESLWNIVHANPDKLRLLRLDREIISHLFAIVSLPPADTTHAALGNALGTLLEFSMDEFCADEIFSQHHLLLPFVENRQCDELTKGLSLQILGNIVFGATNKQDLLFPRIVDPLLQCIRGGMYEHDGSMRIVALALWNLLMYLRPDTVEQLFHYVDTVVLLMDCAEMGTIRIKEKALCALCVFTDLPQLLPEISQNIQLVEVFCLALQASKMTSMRDMSLRALANLGECPASSQKIIAWLSKNLQRVLVMLQSNALRASATRVLTMTLRAHPEQLETVVIWLCAPERRGLTWARDILVYLDAPELTRKHLPLPPGHTHFSWWQNQSPKLPVGQTKFSW